MLFRIISILLIFTACNSTKRIDFEMNGEKFYFEAPSKYFLKQQSEEAILISTENSTEDLKILGVEDEFNLANYLKIKSTEFTNNEISYLSKKVYELTNSFLVEYKIELISGISYQFSIWNLYENRNKQIIFIDENNTGKRRKKFYKISNSLKENKN